jgi:hypothetical protein
LHLSHFCWERLVEIKKPTLRAWLMIFFKHPGEGNSIENLSLDFWSLTISIDDSSLSPAKI